MNRIVRILAALLLSAAFSTIVAAPPPPQQDFAAAEAETDTISVDVRRVVLYVTVREGRSGFVGDLQKEHFTIREDNAVQDILQFSREDVPLAIGLVIDNSQSMMNKKQEVIAAAQAFIRASNPEDEVFVLHFNERLVFGLPANMPFSSDHELLQRAIEGVALDGRTALYDAIHTALEHLERSTLTKKALVVISDGGDNASKHKMQDVVRAAGLSGALFYAVGIYDAMDGDADPRVLRRLANQTGGESFFPEKVSEVSSLCESIARDLRNQYMLVYAPQSDPNDSEFHRIRVNVKDPKKRSLKVRARSGYFGEGARREAGASTR